MNKLRATHQGQIKIGEIEIGCAVLEDGHRVIYRRAFLLALGRHKESASMRNHTNVKLPDFLSSKALKPFVFKDLVRTSNPVYFVHANKQQGVGYDADLLPAVCQVYLRARRAGALRKNQLHIAERAEILMEAFATIGIRALVDEACDHQPIRGEYAKYLAYLLNEEPTSWRKRFPDDYYRYIYQLHGWTYKEGVNQHPQCVGAITNDIVYSRMPPGMLDELQRLNPSDGHGHRPFRHHQFLTDHAGLKALERQVDIAVVLLKSANTWEGFKIALNRISPVLSAQGLNRPHTTEQPFPEQLPLGGIS